MFDEIKNTISKICSEVIGEDVSIEVTIPDHQFGDLSTNVALKGAKITGQPPNVLAKQIVEKIKESSDDFDEINIAGPGFINLKLKDSKIYNDAINASTLKQSLKDKVYVAEYSDPNPFKILHAGHLYTSLVGDSIANLCEMAGAKVYRVNFGGDVGLHVAKAMWAIIDELGGENPEKLNNIDQENRLAWISSCYVKGNAAYESNKKDEIIKINQSIYKIHQENDKTSSLAKIYWTCREWSYQGFDALYKRLAMKPFDRYYPESSVVQAGLNAVKDGIEKNIFTKSDGAIIYDGEKDGLHTRVFINSNGLPTYETKDLGLALRKWHDYKFDKSLIITGNDIKDYMKVIVKVVAQYEKEAAQRSVHRTHGQLKLSGGVKMSSRKGNILTADNILDSAFEASREENQSDEKVVLGAVRYAFLKTRLGSDIIYDPKSSVSVEGNSGPYIQYALVRARSILNKAKPNFELRAIDKLTTEERLLARKISHFQLVFDESLKDYSPHHICNFLFELAHNFNSFYENNRVIGDEREKERLNLITAYEKVLSVGLDALGMPKPERM